MEKSKLSLQKFRILKLKNAKSIIGGTSSVPCDGTKDTLTRPLKCVKTSEEYIDPWGG